MSVPSSRVLDPWPLKMGPIGCPETSVPKERYSLRNISEERRCDIHRERSLKSCTVNVRFLSAPAVHRDTVYVSCPSGLLILRMSKTKMNTAEGLAAGMVVFLPTGLRHIMTMFLSPL